MHLPASGVISVVLVDDAVGGSALTIQTTVAAAKGRTFAAEAFVAGSERGILRRLDCLAWVWIVERSHALLAALLR